MARTKGYGKSKHSEPFRVVADTCWPREADSTHNARYFGSFEEGRAAYMHLVMTQALEERFLERVTFERRSDDGRYCPMFESYQNHTLESYGLAPDVKYRH